MKAKLLLCLIPLVPMACAANKARRHDPDRGLRARLQRARPHIYIKRVYRVADGQAEPGLYKLTLETVPDDHERSSPPASPPLAWFKRLAPLDRATSPTKPNPNDSAGPNLTMLESLLKASSRTLPATLRDDGQTGTLVEGADLPEGCYEPVMSSDSQGKIQLVGWRPSEAEGSRQPLNHSRRPTSATPQDGSLYELVIEQSNMIFRPVSARSTPSEDRSPTDEKREIVPVKHEDEAAKEGLSLGHPRGAPTTTDKMLGELHSDWRQFQPPPWPGRVLVPTQPAGNGTWEAKLYYEGPPLQWEDGRWIPDLEIKKRK